ncbi:MAG: DUF1780 domain-containing protein [Gammaproteobacteria bacterium]|nr:DUF1780 domain-containing protein [Gammaproteobacteria bacterium]
MSDSDNWKESLVRSLGRARRFFSNSGKFERECWVAKTFLRRLGINVEPHELERADEPVDVLVREARFQIKEAMPPGRKRQLEYSIKLSEAEAAKRRADLLKTYTPIEMRGQEIFNICSSYAEKLVSENAYGPKEISNIDLLVYVNYPGNHEFEPYEGRLSASPFRSVSYLSNRYASVIFAAPSAVEWLKDQIGVVSDMLPYEED